MSYSKKILLNGLGHVCEFTILYCRLLVEALALNLKGQFFLFRHLACVSNMHARGATSYIGNNFQSLLLPCFDRLDKINCCA